MSIADYLYGWATVTLALFVGSLTAAALWYEYQMQVERWRARRAPKPAPTPTPRREERITALGWLVLEDGMGAHAPTREEANDLLDRCLAVRADERVLEEVAEAFNRPRHA